MQQMHYNYNSNEMNSQRNNMAYGSRYIEETMYQRKEKTDVQFNENIMQDTAYTNTQLVKYQRNALANID